jgi:NADH:ubiquinone oxidoreductase subunit C
VRPRRPHRGGRQRQDPAIPSAHDLLPPAGIYERQVHDLFGIRFEGHPDLRRLILNEDWPADEFPLRKDWKMDPNKSYGGPPPEVT